MAQTLAEQRAHRARGGRRDWLLFRVREGKYLTVFTHNLLTEDIRNEEISCICRCRGACHNLHCHNRRPQFVHIERGRGAGARNGGHGADASKGQLELRAQRLRPKQLQPKRLRATWLRTRWLSAPVIRTEVKDTASKRPATINYLSFLWNRPDPRGEDDSTNPVPCKESEDE